MGFLTELLLFCLFLFQDNRSEEGNANSSRSALHLSIPLQNLVPAHIKINRGFLSFKSKVKGRKVQFPTAFEGS